MSNEKIKQLLTELRAEIDKTDINEESRSAVQAFESDIHKIIDSPAGEIVDRHSMLESAQRLESSFAATHPHAEQFIRQIVETLAKIGI